MTSVTKSGNDKAGLIERALRIAIIAVVVLAMAIPVISPGVFAASSVSISGGDNVKSGETFTLKVVFKGDNIGRVDAQLTYDDSVISYVSGGSSSGDTGYVQLSTAGTGGNITFNVKFQAASGGSTDVSVTTNDMYDLDEQEMDKPSASKTLSISGGAATTTESTTTTETTEQTETTTASQSSTPDPNIENEEENRIGAGIIIITIIVVLIVAAILIGVTRRRRENGQNGGNGGDNDGSNGDIGGGDIGDMGGGDIGDIG